MKLNDISTLSHIYVTYTHRKQSDYISSVMEASVLTIQRNLKSYQAVDFIFHLTPSGFRYRKVIGYIHQRTEEIIQERRMSLLKEEEQKRLKEKRRLDLLDVLLTAKVWPVICCVSGGFRRIILHKNKLTTVTYIVIC